MSSVTSTPDESFSSIMDMRIGAFPLFSEKLSVAWVRSISISIYPLLSKEAVKKNVRTGQPVELPRSNISA